MPRPPSTPGGSRDAPGSARMTKLRILHRPDGVIELRRRRLRDSAALQDLALLLGLCAGCAVFIFLLATLIVETPVVLAAAAAFLLPVASAVLLARGSELTHAAARSPRPRSPRPRPPDHAA